MLTPPLTTEGLNAGLNMAWEVDFWGRFRRAIVAAEDTLEANCADYNGAMVTLLGDVAKYYVQLRTDQKRIELVRANATLQRRVLEIARRRFREGQTNDLDLNQARSTLAQTEAQIPLLLSDLRAAEIRLCVLMGMPPAALESQLGPGRFPRRRPAVVVGIPADLLRRRPDVCRAERLAAAQAEQIGIAEVDLYPVFKINGNMGYSAANALAAFREQRLLRRHRPGGSVEHPELRPDPQQHADARREVPGARHGLPADGAAGGGRGGKRAVALLAGTGAFQAARRKRGAACNWRSTRSSSNTRPAASTSPAFRRSSRTSSSSKTHRPLRMARWPRD